MIPGSSKFSSWLFSSHSVILSGHAFGQLGHEPPSLFDLIVLQQCVQFIFCGTSRRISIANQMEMTLSRKYTYISSAHSVGSTFCQAVISMASRAYPAAPGGLQRKRTECRSWEKKDALVFGGLQALTDTYIKSGRRGWGLRASRRCYQAPCLN